MTKHLGLVTCSKCKDLIPSEQPLIPLFAKKEVKAVPLVWNDPSADWKAFDILVIRSVWDYHLYPTDFLNWIDRVENLGIRILNPAPVIRFNHHKFYLRDLAKAGYRVIPTEFIPKTQNLDLSFVDRNGWEKAVIKPAISASAWHTKLFASSEISSVEERFRSLAAERDLLVQKFIPEIGENGELSLVFFNRVYSHTVLKKPREGEFRVQEELGGSSSLIEPNGQTVHEVSEILKSIPGDLLYARMDGVLIDNRFVLMEAELIEPDLFLDYHAEARTRLVDSTIKLMRS